MLNKKGFAITSILYGIMLLFLVVLLVLLATLRIQNDNLERSTSKINDKFCNIEEIQLADKEATVYIDKTCKYKVLDGNNGFCGIYYLKKGDSISLFPNFNVISSGVDITNNKISCDYYIDND